MRAEDVPLTGVVPITPEEAKEVLEDALCVHVAAHIRKPMTFFTPRVPGARVVTIQALFPLEEES